MVPALLAAQVRRELGYSAGMEDLPRRLTETLKSALSKPLGDAGTATISKKGLGPYSKAAGSPSSQF